MRIRPFLALVLVACMPAAPPALERQDITVANGDVTLAGTVVRQEGTTVRQPGVILIHGSGPDDRTNPYYGMLANAFVQRGFVVLTYDKRGSGASQGDWRRPPFDQVIGDADAMLRALRRHPWVDSTRVGIWGGSEGGAIAPEVARRAGNAAFVIMQSSPAGTFAEQNIYQTARQAEGMTRDSAGRAAARRLQELRHHYARTGQGWDEYASEVRAAQGQPYAGLAQPSRSDSWWWAWYRTKMDYTPITALEQLRVPVLAIWGELDQLMPARASMERISSVRGSLRIAADSFAVVPHADHTLYINGLRGMFIRGLRNRPVHFDAMTEWAQRQVRAR